ncbi:MAG: YDG domain-containing protein [Thermoguttaceae bacterium]
MKRKIRERSLRLESLEDRFLLAVVAGGETAAAELAAPAETGATIVVTDLTYAALQSAITGASNGDTIIIEGEGTINLTSRLRMTRSVTIDGGGTVTLAGPGNNVLFMFSNSCTLNGLNLTGGYSTVVQYGGIGQIANGITVTLNDCNIYGNSAVEVDTGANWGGGFYVFGQLNMSNCNVYNNTATYGGFAQINGQSNNGAATLNAVNCNFYGNTATGYGAVIGNQGGTLILTNCSVVGNSSPQGAITNYNFFLCDENSGSTYDPNNPGEYNHKYFITDTTITNSIIAYNYSPDAATADIFDRYGMALWGQGAIIYPLLRKEDIYTKAETTNTIIGLAGDYFVEAPILDDAGNLVNADTLDLTIDTNGIAAYAGIGANPGAYTGGGISADSLVVTTLDDVIDPTDGFVSLREALACAAVGGFTETPTVTFADGLAGGTIELTGGQIDISFDVNIVADNITLDAMGSGRALYLKSYNYQMNLEGNYQNFPSVPDCPEHNYSEEYLIDVSVDGLNFVNGSIELASSATGGAGIFAFQNANLALSNSTVSNNTLRASSAVATSACGGGGIAAFYYSSVALNSSEVVDNTVIQVGERDINITLQGGGIFVGTRSILNVLDSTISRNTLTSTNYQDDNTQWGFGRGYGAGICSKGDLTEISYSEVSDNSTRGCALEQYGAGIYNNVSLNPRSESYGMLVDNTIIARNTLGDHNVENNGWCRGGGIYNTGRTLLINNLIANNSFDAGNEVVNMYARINGAGVYNEAAIDIYYCTITENVAACIDYDDFATGSLNFGGGFYNTGTEATPNLVGCILLNNYSENSTTGVMAYNDMYHDGASFVLSNTIYRTAGVKGSGYTYVNCVRWADRYTLFTDAAAEDYTLVSDAVAIDKVAEDATFHYHQYDLRNDPYLRIYNEVQDIGCYEYQPDPQPPQTFELTLTDWTGTYDGTAHTITIGGTEAGDVINYSSDGVNYGTDVLSYSAAGTHFVYILAQRAGYEDFTGSARVMIDAKALTVSGSSVADKVYDGTTAAEVTVGTVAGIVAGDDVTVTGAAEFPSPEVGEYNVTVSYALTGADALNYIAPADESVIASITSGGGQLAAPTIQTGIRGVYVSGGANRHQIVWSEVANVSGYELSYTTGGGAWTSLETTETRAVVLGLTYGTDVTYRVRALGTGSYTDSDWSPSKTFNVCPMDINNDGDISGGDRALLSSAWLAEEGDDEYRIYCDINGDGDISNGDRVFISRNWLSEAGDADLTYPPALQADAVFAEFASADLDVDLSVF